MVTVAIKDLAAKASLHFIIWPKFQTKFSFEHKTEVFVLAAAFGAKARPVEEREARFVVIDARQLFK